MPLIPTQKAESSRSTTGVAYTIDSQAIPEAKLSLVLPLPASSADLEDLDSFEVLLRQYGSLPGDSTALKDLAAPHLAGGPSTGVSVPGGTAGAGGEDKDMRGKLVLVNEDNGEVVGELDHDLDLEEDHSVSKDDKDKPVVLDFGNVIDGYMPVVKVRTVPEDEMDDWILKGAHYLR
jgi:spartin